MALVVGGIAIAATACGAASQANLATLRTTTSTRAAAPARGQASGDQFVRYAKCMRSHGVLDFPDDPSSPAIRALKQSGAMSSHEFQAAAQACAKYAHHGAPPPQISTADQADYLRAATCMRNHGIAGFPDPTFVAGDVNFPVPHDMNTKSPQFRRAREICEALIPAGLPYSKSDEAGN